MTPEAAPAPAGHPVLADLNPSQREAVAAPGGPTLVLAGAGSGKTRVITHRIGWRMLEEGAPADSILAVTFTNKAAREMRTRVQAFRSAAGDAAGTPWVSTFHALGLNLLRRFGRDIGLPAGFPVFGADESRALLREVSRELALDDDRLPLRRLVQVVSRVRNAEATGVAVRGSRDPRIAESIRQAVNRYEERLGELKGVDFDDLLIRSLELLETSAAARSFVARRARHLLIDEYQDTSPLQHLLVLKLAPHRDVFAVGDDDQAIYSFRGADFRNILRFHEEFPGARVFRLEENYRSTAAIVDAASAVIQRNRRRHGKTLRPVGGRGEMAAFRFHSGETEEAQAIALDIAGQGEARGTTAVLLRTRAQTRAFEEAFTAHRIPHVIVGGLRFYERKEVLDALAWIRVARNPEDDSAFRRALAAVPRGVGPKSVGLLRERAERDGASLLATAETVVAEGALPASPPAFLPARTVRGLGRFVRGIEALRRAVPRGPAAAVKSAIRDSGLGDLHQENDRERFENLQSLQNAAREFERSNPDAGVDAFLDQVSLLSAEDFVPDEEPDGGSHEAAAPKAAPVTVMTVHAAKGLEFDSVFLAGLWEGLFPHALSLESESQLEEERRLFYVGMTRARKRLRLSAAPSGAPYLRARGRVSRFLGEIPPELLVTEERSGRAAPAASAPSGGLFRRGDTVRHPKFGVGRVESVDPDGKRLSVIFRLHGRRRLVLDFAPLERIGRGARDRG